MSLHDKSLAGKRFSTWAGWLLCYDTPLVLLSSPERIETLMRELIRIGLDQVVGYIPSLEGYAPSELETVPQLTTAEAKALIDQGQALVLDVHGADEYRAGHVPGAINIHAGRIMKQLNKVPREGQLIVHCSSGDRSSTAISALLAEGYHNVSNLTGGFSAWHEHGFPVETQEAVRA